MAEVENRIMQTAREMFFRYGFRSVTMDDICRSMGISKKTFYRCYSEKNRLVEELVKNTTEGNLSDICRITSQSENAIHEYILMMKHMADFFLGMNPVIFYDMVKYYPEAYGVFKQYRDKQVFQVVEQNLERGIKEKLYRHDIPVRLLARLRIEEISMVFTPEIFNRNEYSIAQIHTELMKHFLHGIVTLRGHEAINAYLNVHETEN